MLEPLQLLLYIPPLESPVSFLNILYILDPSRISWIISRSWDTFSSPSQEYIYIYIHTLYSMHYTEYIQIVLIHFAPYFLHSWYMFLIFFKEAVSRDCWPLFYDLKRFSYSRFEKVCLQYCL